MGCERTDLVGCTVKDIKQINEDKFKDDERQLFVTVVFFCDYKYAILKETVIIILRGAHHDKQFTTAYISASHEMDHK